MFDLISLEKRIRDFDAIEKGWTDEQQDMEKTIDFLTKDDSEFLQKKNDLKAELLALQAEFEQLLLNPPIIENKEETVEPVAQIEQQPVEEKPAEAENVVPAENTEVKTENTPEQIEKVTENVEIPVEPTEKAPEAEEKAPEVPEPVEKVEPPVEAPPAPEEKIPEPIVEEKKIEEPPAPVKVEAAPASPAPKKHLKKKKRGAKEAAADDGAAGEKKFNYDIKHTLINHLDCVRAVCFHPKEPFYASGSDDGTIKFVNISPPKPAGKRVRTVPRLYRSIRVGDSPVLCMASGDNFVFAGQVNGNINKYEYGNVKSEIFQVHGSIDAHLLSVYQADDAVWSIASNPNSPFIVAACADGTIRIIDVATFDGVSVELGAIPTSVAFDDKGETYAVGCQNGALLIMKGNNGEIVGKKKYDTFINTVVYSNEEFVAGTVDGKILCQKSGNTIDAHTDSVTALAVFKGYLISASNDGFVKAWKDNENVFQVEASKEKKFGECIYSISSSDSHSAFAVSLANGAVLVFEPKK